MRQHLMFATILLSATLSAAAQTIAFQAEDEAIDRPVRPYQCEAWEALIEERLASDDPLERRLGEVYGDQAFSWCEVRRVRVSEERESRWDFNLPGIATLAEIMRVLAIAGLIALVIWALWRWRRQIGQIVGTVSRRSRRPVETATQTPLPEAIELPPDISARARELWNQGRSRDAVSLLYRGALAQLLSQVRSAESRTEREVQRLLRAQGFTPATLAYMDGLILCWQRTAWAHQPPGSEEFERLLSDWRQYCLTPRTQGAAT